MASGRGTFETRLIELIGQAKTQALIDRFGGHYLYLPSEAIDGDHTIAQVVGLASARLLCEEWPGLRLLIPTGYEARLEARNERIRALRSQGATVPELVSAFGLSPRQVYNVIGPQGASRLKQTAT